MIQIIGVFTLFTISVLAILSTFFKKNTCKCNNDVCECNQKKKSNKISVTTGSWLD